MNSRARATIYMLALFGAGGICGAVVMRHFAPPAESQPLKLGRVDEIAAKIDLKLMDRLQLTADQKAKAEPMIRAASQKLEDAHANCLKQIDQAIGQLHHDMRPFLTDEQISKLAAMDKERADSMAQKYNYCPTVTNQPDH